MAAADGAAANAPPALTGRPDTLELPLATARWSLASLGSSAVGLWATAGTRTSLPTTREPAAGPGDAGCAATTIGRPLARRDGVPGDAVKGVAASAFVTTGATTGNAASWVAAGFAALGEATGCALAIAGPGAGLGFATTIGDNGVAKAAGWFATEARDAGAAGVTGFAAAGAGGGVTSGA